MASATKANPRSAPQGELGADLIALPAWSAFGLGLRGFSVDREDVAELRWPASVRTFAHMRNDTQLSGLYRAGTLPVRRYVWGIDANGADPKVVDNVCRDFNLPTMDEAWQAFLTGKSGPVPRARNRFSWDKHSTDAQRAIYNGHYYFELHGAIVDDGLWHPEDASPRSPWTIAFIEAAPNGDLVAIKQMIGLNTPELAAERLIAYVFDQEPGDWTGRSAYRSCYREWLLKDRLLRVDAINHEKAGGILLNEAPKDATPDQIEALSKLAQNARVGGGGAVPAGTTPVFIRGTGSDVIGSINRHDESMAREFLAMFMALGTSSSGGNRALAGSFLDWFALAQEATAIWQRDTFQQQAIDRYVEWNFGDQDYVPLLAFKRPEDANPLDLLAAGVTTGANAGEPGAVGVQDTNGEVVPVAAVRFGRGGWSLVPQIVVDGDLAETVRGEHAAFEAWAGRAPRSSRRTPSAAANGRSGGRHSDPAAAAAPDTIPLPDRPLRREPTEQEIQAQADFKTIDSQWSTQTGSLVDAWKTVRAGQIASLVQQITDADGDLAALAAIAAAPEGADLIATHLHTMASLGAGQAVNEAKKQGVVAASTPALDDLNAELTARAAALEQLLASSISSAAATKAVQLSGGKVTAADVADDVRAYLNGLSDAWLHDQMGGALSAAQNGGRLAAMEHNGASRYYASELLDENTCDPCAEEDGTEFATADEAAAAYPAGGYYDCQGGPRCRGTIVAVYDEASST